MKFARPLLFFLFIFLPPVFSADVRPAAVAGSFYPSDPIELSRELENFLSQTPSTSAQEFWGMIVPHAGIQYSGQVAAFGYKLLEGRGIETVILLGPSHRIPFSGASVWQEGNWETPLGQVEIDSELARAIAAEDSLFQYDTKVHLIEHSLEVQVIFLQKVLPHAKIVPILLGDLEPETFRKIATAIQKHTDGKKVVVLASSDMSHYHSGDVAKTIDHRTIETIKKKNPDSLHFEIVSGKEELCGAGAVIVMLELAKLKGHSEIEFLKYAHSGEASGVNDRVVGYSAWILTKASSEHQELLAIARQAIEAKIRRGEDFQPQTNNTALKEPRAVFVTLRKNGELRGCIGEIMPSQPLYLAVKDKAIAAATQDPRFIIVGADDLPDLKIEISILTLPRPIASADEIEMGKHGVILRSGEHSGVFLPEVATETGWSREQFLSELCSQKAGLPSSCWQDPNTQLLIFESEHFSES